MTYQHAERAGQSYAQTGSLTNSFFQGVPGVTYSSSDEARESPIYTEPLNAPEVATASDDLSGRVLRLEQELDLIRAMLHRALNPTSQSIEEEEEPFEQWLKRWQEEDPDAFITDAEILDTIHRYEEKYGMTSEEMLRRAEEGTTPDDFEIMEWKILWEWTAD